VKNGILICAFLPLLIIAQQRKEVLFIGNSYTYVNLLPDLLKQIALSFGDSLIHDSSTPGGANFNIHTNNTQTLAKINQQQWDYVVLQAQSQEPSFSLGQVANNTYPYAEILVDSIHANSSCTEPLFFMTWGRKYGDQQNCAVYPPVCTYLGMQQRLRESYLEMAFYDSASCSPVGMAWKELIALDSTINLYSSDNSHPSIYGSYLAACTFYASIFKKSPIGSSFWPSAIDSSTAYSLQQIGSSTVLESLAVWNIFNADFSFMQTNDSISCTNLSSNYESLIWDFGDGTILNDTISKLLHTYNDTGHYQVNLAISNLFGCTDTISYTIIIVPIFIIYIPDAFTPNGDNINDAFGPSVYGIKEFEMKIYDRWGQIIYHTTEKDKPWDGTINNNETQAGVYTYSIVATDLKEKPHKYVGAFISIR